MSESKFEYVLVKLTEPVGPGDAHKVARDIILNIEGVEETREARHDGFGRIVSKATGFKRHQVARDEEVA